MRATNRIAPILAVIGSLTPGPLLAQVGLQATTPEGWAIAFLTREVPAWSKTNGCYSCHNNGDAARALYLAHKRGFRIPAEALADTTAWVRDPARWDKNKGDPGFSDKRLADIQFASSLLAAVEAGKIIDRSPLTAAARKLIAGQDPDGSWKIDSGNRVGSPATYGTTLATVMALRALNAIDTPESKKAASKAAIWFHKETPVSLNEAAAILMIPGIDKKQWAGLRGQSLAWLHDYPTSDGGWGPYANSPSEIFDTALALLALAPYRSQPPYKEVVRRGREFLIKTQEADGGWPATTRPSGVVSYAQRISTTGWALLALIETTDKPTSPQTTKSPSSP